MTEQSSTQMPIDAKRTTRTKIVGYLMVIAAVCNTAVDALNGGGFNAAAHLSDLYVALGGAGLVFARDAISKVERAIKSL